MYCTSCFPLLSHTDKILFYDFQVGLPTADLDVDLPQYVDLICGEGNIPFQGPAGLAVLLAATVISY